MDPMLISLVSALTALVASMVAPFVTLAVARRQFAATVISANRQRWVIMLREHVAEFLAILAAVSVFKADWKQPWDKGLPVIHADPAKLDKVERMVLVFWQIRLLLNPTEADHQQLVAAVETAIEHMRAEDAGEEQTRADIEAIARISQGILKREWERVKQGR
jgi:hypothetical protein